MVRFAQGKHAQVFAWAVAAAATTTALLMLGGCESSQKAPPPVAYNSQSELDEAFEQGANRPPTADTLYRMGRIYAAQGKDDQATAVFRNTIARFPNYMPAYCDLAQLQVRQRKVGAAILTLQQGLKIDDQDAVLHNDLGMCHVMNGNYEAAATSFGRAAEINPDDARYVANQAMATGMLGRYDESLSLYQQVLRPAEAHYNLAVVCEARNDMNRANEEYARARALDGDLERKPLTR